MPFGTAYVLNLITRIRGSKATRGTDYHKFFHVFSQYTILTEQKWDNILKGRSQWCTAIGIGVGLKPLDCCYLGFESR